MPAPDNDLRANATVLDASLGWGIVRGTTVGATEEPGEPYGPVFTPPLRSVWYSLADLLPGTFFFHLEAPTPPSTVIYRFAVFRCAPSAAVVSVPVLISGDSTTLARRVAFADHLGGPLTIVVLTLDSPSAAGGEGPFVFGWGSAHDQMESHYRPGPREWAYEQVYNLGDSPLDPARPGPSSLYLNYSAVTDAKTRGVFAATSGAILPQPFVTPPIPNDPATDVCVYNNARWGQRGRTQAERTQPCPGFLGLAGGAVHNLQLAYGVGQTMVHASGSFAGAGVNGHLVEIDCTIQNQFVYLGDPSLTTEGSSLADRPPAFVEDETTWGFVFDSGWSYAYNELRDLILYFSCIDRRPQSSLEPPDPDPTPWDVEVRYLLPNDRVPTNVALAERVADKWGYQSWIGWQTPTRTDQPVFGRLGLTPDVYYPVSVPEPTPYFLRDAPNQNSLPGPVVTGPVAFAPRPSRQDRPSFISMYETSTHVTQGHLPVGNVTNYGFSVGGVYSHCAATRDYYMRGLSIEWRPPPYRLYGFALGCPPFAKAAFKRRPPRVVESYKASMRVKRIKPVKLSVFQGLRCRFGPCNAKRSKVRVVPHEGG